MARPCSARVVRPPSLTQLRHHPLNLLQCLTPLTLQCDRLWPWVLGLAMRRRDFIGWCGSAVIMSMPPSRAQKSRTRPLIAWLGGSSPAMAARDLNGFLQGLKDFNHVDGTDIDIVYRWANGDLSQQPKLVRELLALGPDLVVTANGDAAVEARRASATIPIVCPDLIDPIGSGMAASYNHPGYNVTGVLLTLDGLVGKQLEILADLLPRARTVAILV